MKLLVLGACFLLLCGGFIFANAMPTEDNDSAGFGDRLLRTFILFRNQPLTVSQVIAKGWEPFMGNSCNSQYGGIPYSHSAYGPSEFNPTFLIYSPAGQLSGFGVRVWGSMSSYLVKNNMMIQVSNNVYDIFLTTRDPSSVCSGQTYSQVLGDRLLLNGFFPIPLNMSGAEASGWVMGNCIGRMGIHHAYDLAAPGNQTWNPSSLVPIMPMYDAQRHTINAVLFNVWNLQDIEPLGVWEGPFPSSLFCLNWCANTGCHFSGVTVWTTLHWHFVNPSSISCRSASCVL